MASKSNIVGDNLRSVRQVNGQVLQVQGKEEETWFNVARDKYLTETKFTEKTDLQDLDRLLGLELMIYRWTRHLAAGVDYDGNMANDEQLRRNLKEQSDAVTKIKTSMGLTKAARDDRANTGDLSEYIANLKSRAKLFGIHREKQLTKALTLLHELFSIVDTFDRSDEEERRKVGFETEAEILDWIRVVAHPEFNAIDEHFRNAPETGQRYWVKAM